MELDKQQKMKERGRRIEVIRKSKYVSATEIAAYLGISRRSYKRVEDGVRDMLCHEVQSICTYLGIHPLRVMAVQEPSIPQDRIRKMAQELGFSAAESHNPRIYALVQRALSASHNI
ncbi:helix-turn-helix domain-containing protein [Acinetobacter sp. ANC 3813]|uniref:helix-turn-helix domain-containing protein n=1 Tax=Acinetobacter sp. ANC 3813 TaxID=1977873 RepID=UPI000A32D385|nr:helix-turn-helix transcriptional regulator [Acinetobacter sp. ANC 3813]OTG87842.1 hypothetical protein B9T34_16025 [Acinetobacter sp. ANC 3813]